MCSADEVALVYALYWAGFAASAAVGALFVIYYGKIVLNDDSAARAYLFALAACYTSVFAILAHLCALVVVVAGNGNARSVADKMDYTVGTFLSAKTASYALFGIDGSGSLVVYAYSISRAYLYAIAVAKAGEGAEVIAGVIDVCRLAGLRTVIIVLFLFGKAKTVAGNVSNLLDNVSRFNAHNLCDIVCRAVTSGNTEVDSIGFALGESLCIRIASGKSASTAVCTRQAVADSNGALVLFNSKENGRNGKDYCTNNSY